MWKKWEESFFSKLSYPTSYKKAVVTLIIMEGDRSIVRRPISPTADWSDDTLVRRLIGPTAHWSDGPLVLRYRINVDNKFVLQLFY